MSFNASNNVNTESGLVLISITIMIVIAACSPYKVIQLCSRRLPIHDPGAPEAQNAATVELQTT